MNVRTKDLTGQRFHRLKVMGISHSTPAHRLYWNVMCDCGTPKVVRGDILKRGTTKSCGCYIQQLRSTPRQAVSVTTEKKLFGQYKRGAVVRDVPFSLSQPDVIGLAGKSCHYCGAAPGNVMKYKGKAALHYSGIDRVDNTQGYILANCVPCCAQCNIAKNDYSASQFKEWVTRVYLKIGAGHG